MAFATDPATHAYYERRAAEYDDWWNATGLFVDRQRPGWGDAVERVVRLLRDLPPEIGGEPLLRGRWFVAARA
jgi:hypothetical protein